MRHTTNYTKHTANPRSSTSTLRRLSLVSLALLAFCSLALCGSSEIRSWLLRAVFADNTAQTLPFSQNWATTTLITTSDSWSGVPGIEGYFLRNDGVSTTAVDPQTILGDTFGAGTTTVELDVNANQTNPNTFTTGGVAEFDTLANPTVALQGSGTADAPFILIYLNTTGQQNINVAYNLRDVDGSADNAAQPVALQFRVGSSGAFTNLPAGFVADATTGPSLATLVTPVSVTLPAAADNQPLVQVRVITTNAAGSDEWVGVDDINITGAPIGPTPTLNINDASVTEGDGGTVIASFTVGLSAPAPAGGVTFNIATQDNTAMTANNDYVTKSLTGQTIAAGNSTYTFDVTVNGDTNVEPNETFFVNVTSVMGANLGDGQGVGTITNDDVTITPIRTIQGGGTTSPFAGMTVTTKGIVTGVRSNGFFIQEPDGTIDADPNTSEGIFVFTSSAPPAAATVGNLVQVGGTVQEFIPSADPLSPPLTEIAGSPTVTLVSTGNSLPTPITLTSGDTGAGGVNAGSIENLERSEGMRVRVNSLTVVAPTGGNVNEPNATATSNGVFFGVITGVTRPFREPGIQANDPVPAGSGVTIPPVPRFDFNPERLRVDSDALVGAAAINVATGATVSNLVGPLDYAFRTYTILPDPASPPTVSGGMTATPVAAPLGNELTIAAYNLERFFDDVNDPAIGDPVLTTTAYNNRLNKASIAVRNFLRSPDILGVVEVENLSTLQTLATKINSDAVANSQPNPLYVAYLVEGNDIGGIDVGFLVKTSVVFGATPRVTVNAVVQEGKTTLFTNPDSSTDLLNDRPSLRLDATVNFPNGTTFPVTVLVNHLRSLNDIDSTAAGSNGWPTTGARVRAKRRAQAEFLANLVQARQTANSNERIALIGDFNAFEFNDGFVDSMGTIQGAPTPAAQVVLASGDLVNPDLTNLFSAAPATERYSYSFDGSAQSLDHVLVNQALIAGTLARRVEHPRIDADFPETARNDANTAVRLSDHDPIVGYFQLPPCAISCPANITTTAATGQCGAMVNYSAPITSGDCGAPVTCTPPSGSLFAVGTTTVNCTTPSQNSCSFNVTVRDTQAPAVTCPSDIVTNAATNQCAATVNFTATASDNCPGATVSCAPASGSTFQVGVTTVNCQATDAAGNTSASCSFTVRVNDAQAPVISCPTSFAVGSTSNSGRAVTYPAPAASDNCSGVGTPTCTPPSGSNFPLGTTTVTCAAADASGNSASCSFAITVNQVALDVKDQLGCTGPGNVVTGTFTLTNNGAVPTAASATVALPGGLLALPNTCASNVGACSVVNASTVTFQATLAPGQTATVSYQSQVGDQVTTGTQLCANLTASFGAGPPLSTQACVTANCPAVGPGALPQTTSPVNDQRAGSVLIYNIFTSSTDPNRQNTRINLTNTNPSLPAFAHMFFIDGATCSVADSYICLTPNQTATFLVSDLDPGTTGYIVVVAVDRQGCPTNFNYLIGDEYVKFTSGHAANLGAEAITAIAGGRPFCNENSVTATLPFDGVSYSVLPHAVALDNLASRADGNETMLILNRIGGNLATATATLTAIFGLLYDDAENTVSFSFAPGTCQFRNVLTNSLPRTAPRFDSVIPAGRTGWMRLWVVDGTAAITGAAINFNTSAAANPNAFNQGHNLHVLTLTRAASFTIPIFPPSC